MSDDRGATRPWRLYIQDMIEFAERVLSFTKGMDQDSFIADRRTYGRHAAKHRTDRHGGDACAWPRARGTSRD